MRLVGGVGRTREWMARETSNLHKQVISSNLYKQVFEDITAARCMYF